MQLISCEVNMEQNDLEKELKEEAKKIKAKSFSERWTIIKSKINNVEPVTREEQLIDVPATVSAGGGVNTTSSKYDLKRKRLIVGISLAVLFCLIILAVVLPFSLTPDRGMRFYEIGDLRIDNVDEDTFYDAFEETGLNIVDFSNYESTSYAIYYSSDSAVKGGIVEADSDNYFLTIKIYTPDVNVDTLFDDEHEVYNGVIDINYHTEYVNDIYNTIGQANYLGMRYVIEYMSLYDDVILLFNDIFV